MLQIYNEQVVGVDLPAAVELTVTETEPGVQGDRVSVPASRPPWRRARSCRFPLFVNPGDKIKVDTRSGEYLTRVLSE